MTLRGYLALVLDRLFPQRLDEEVFPLEQAVKTLGARDVLYRSQIYHGYTEWRPSGVVLQVAMGRTDGRRRSVLAHECGHLAFDPLMPPDYQPYPEDQAGKNHREFILELLGDHSAECVKVLNRYGIERVCDVFSAELIFPLVHARQLQISGPDLDSLSRIASGRRISLATLVFSLNEAGGDYTLIRFRQPGRGGPFLATSRYGVPRSLQSRVTCEGVGSPPSGTVVSTTVSLGTVQGSVNVQGEWRAVGDGAWLLCSRRELIRRVRLNSRVERAS